MLCYVNATRKLPWNFGFWDYTTVLMPATRPRAVDIDAFIYPSQLRLVLDLATLEGCKAELT